MWKNRAPAAVEKSNTTSNPYMSPEQVLEFLGGISKTTLWRMYTHGDFPKPIRVSERNKLFDRNEVVQWLESQKVSA